ISPQLRQPTPPKETGDSQKQESQDEEKAYRPKEPWRILEQFNAQWTANRVHPTCIPMPESLQPLAATRQLRPNQELNIRPPCILLRVEMPLHPFHGRQPKSIQLTLLDFQQHPGHSDHCLRVRELIDVCRPEWSQFATEEVIGFKNVPNLLIAVMAGSFLKVM